MCAKKPSTWERPMGCGELCKRGVIPAWLIQKYLNNDRVYDHFQIFLDSHAGMTPLAQFGRSPSLPVPMWKASSRNMYDIDGRVDKREYFSILQLDICHHGPRKSVYVKKSIQFIHINIERASSRFVFEAAVPAFSALPLSEYPKCQPAEHTSAAVSHSSIMTRVMALAVPVGRRSLEEVAAAVRRWRTPYPPDRRSVQQRVAHLLRGNLPQVSHLGLPLKCPN